MSHSFTFPFRFPPAACLGCGRWFEARGIELGSASVEFHNCTAGPCPFCGSKGMIPNGVHRALNGVIQVFLGAETASLERLRQVLNAARDAKASADVVAERVEAATPEFKGIAELVKKNNTLILPILAFLLAVLTLILSRFPPGPRVPPFDVEKVVREVWERVNADAASKEETAAKKKLGRNDPCHCGNGKKYKKCHGR